MEHREPPSASAKALERLALAYSKQFQALVQTARKEIADGNGIPHDDFWNDLSEAVQADAG